MNVVLLAARLLLATVFFVAGVAKLADLKGSRKSAIEFGVPAALAGPFGLLLPLVEFTVAGTLIPASTALWGAIGALALLLLFALGIGVNLVRGRKPDCHCFGQLYSAPAGWKVLLRNVALAAVAGFLVWRGGEGNVGPSVVAWSTDLSNVLIFLVLMGGIVVLGLLAAQWRFPTHLLRHNDSLSPRIEALESSLATSQAMPSRNGYADLPTKSLPIGVRAPIFTLEDIYGETLTLDGLRASGRPVMLLFIDPECGPCAALLPDIGRWKRKHTEKLSIVLISRGNAEENRAKVSEHGLDKVLLQKDWEVSEAYGVEGTPSAILIQPDGTVGSPLAIGVANIRALVTRMMGIDGGSVQEQLQAKLEILQKEFEIGQVELQKVEDRRTYLRETLLRIGGAIQLLEELLGKGQLTEQRDGSGTSENYVGSVRTSEGKEAI